MIMNFDKLFVFGIYEISVLIFLHEYRSFDFYIEVFSISQLFIISKPQMFIAARRDP